MPYGLEHVKAFRRKNKQKKRETWTYQVMQKIYLVNMYKNTRQDTHTRYKKTAKKSKSLIKDDKQTPYFDSNGCPCGRKQTYHQCNACKIPAVKTIMELSAKCAKILIDYDKRETNDANVTLPDATNIWDNWRELNNNNWCKFIKGNLDISKEIIF